MVAAGRDRSTRLRTGRNAEVRTLTDPLTLPTMAPTDPATVPPSALAGRGRLVRFTVDDALAMLRAGLVPEDATAGRSRLTASSNAVHDTVL